MTAGEATIVLPAATLKRVIRAVAPAASTDYGRPQLECVRVVWDGELLTVAATDSYRLHHLKLTRAAAKPTVDSKPAAASIPAWWLARWARSRIGRGDEVVLRFGGDTCTLTYAAGVVDSIRPDAGTYPDLGRLLEGSPPPPAEKNPAINPRLLAGVFAAAHVWAPSQPLHVDQLHPMQVCRFRSVHPTDGILSLLVMPVRW